MKFKIKCGEEPAEKEVELHLEQDGGGVILRANKEIVLWICRGGNIMRNSASLKGLTKLGFDMDGSKVRTT